MAVLFFGLPYVKKHFDAVVPISRNFKKEARWTELNRTQAKIPNVSFVMGFNVASPTVWVFELALNQQIRAGPSTSAASLAGSVFSNATW
jgi:hypothetical protein